MYVPATTGSPSYLTDAWPTSNPYNDSIADQIGYTFFKDSSVFPVSIVSEQKVYKKNGSMWETVDGSLHTLTNSIYPAAMISGNAYFDSAAKSIGYGYLNNIVAKYEAPFWKPITNLNYVLNADFQWQHLLSNLGVGAGVSTGTGLVYTGTTGVFANKYVLMTEFGGAVSWWNYNSDDATCAYANEHMNTTNICATRGMRLPTIAEVISSPNSSSQPLNKCAKAGIVGGVPLFPGGNDIWTATPYNTSNLSLSGRNFTQGMYADASSEAQYVRCVR